MIQIDDKAKCSGCSACASICPTNCITMKEDSEGFLYPYIDSEKCIHCNNCNEVCPIKNTSFHKKDGYPDAYLGYSKDNTLRVNSAAGGGFAAIATWYIQRYGAVVYGAAYEGNYHVKHVCIDRVEDLYKLQKSKYVQSELGDVFSHVKERLQENRYVLFSGTPCQIYGLKSFLDHSDMNKLLCIDLSCHGVPSPLLLKKYLEYLEKNNGKIKTFIMRDKKLKANTYEQGFGIEFYSGKKLFNSHVQDLYGRCFWGEIASRPSCYQCHFKTVWRAADITIGDCWFFNCFVPEEQDRMGVTMFLAQSEIGKATLEACDLLKLYKVPAEAIIKANGGMIYSSASPNCNRAVFFERLGKEDFKRLVDELIPEKRNRYKVIQSGLEREGIELKHLKKFRRHRLLKDRLKRVIPISALGEMK